MEQHPIPQQISSYQFRLVGDMTLKQFFQVAGGVLISLIFYSSKLPAIVKWPFILFFSLLGVALAFLPFEDRPLETWIISFFKSVYSPTIFNWRKMKTTTPFFRNEVAAPQENTVPSVEQEKINRYLATPGGPSFSFVNKLEEAEAKFLSLIGNIFVKGGPASGEILVTQTPPVTNKQGFVVPASSPVSFAAKRTVVEEKPIQGSNLSFEKVSQTLTEQQAKPMFGAQFSIDAAPPSPPTVVNTVVGQVIDEKGKIIEGAILEVKDAAGRPVRALKSNKLGHFLVVTPLQSGRYEIFSEKDNFIFDPVYFEAQGNIIPPIFIKGENKINPIVSETLS
ncbi:MAG: hypothetical protein ABIJ05_04165 [Patescibacteria group bacterium]